MIDGDHMGWQNEFAGVDGEAIGERAGVGAMLDECGNRGQPQLLVIGCLAGASQGAEQREAEEEDEDRSGQSPRADVRLPRARFRFGYDGFHDFKRAPGS